MLFFMVNSIQKRGRKRKPFTCSWDDGKPIHGLYHQPDGRWRVVATGYRFSESDERLAVKRFLELTAGARRMVAIPVNPANEPVRVDLARLRGTFLPPAVLAQAVEALPASMPLVSIGEDGNLLFTRDVDELGFYAAVRHILINKREYAAMKTGIEQVAWLTDLKKPVPSPALKQMVDLYVSKPGLSNHEQSRSRLFWKEFLRWSGVTTLAGITHESVQRFEDKARGGSLGPKSVKHRFSKVKCIIAYALKRGADAVECRRALDVLKMLEMPKATGLDPHPISPEHFWMIYDAAIAADDQAFATILLVSLNCCMYPGEVSDLEWSEVNLKTGEVVTRRPKTGVARVAILWAQTLMAISALPRERERDNLFFSERGAFNANVVGKRWTIYAKQLGLKSVHFSDIRDASYTVACQSVSLDKAKILAGHRLSGATDHYVMRNPGFVQDACAAIAKAFNVAGHVS